MSELPPSLDRLSPELKASIRTVLQDARDYVVDTKATLASIKNEALRKAALK